MLFSRLTLSAVCLSCFAAYSSHAAVINANWNAAVSGDWDDPANWSSVDFPDNATDTFVVTIDATGAPYTVTLNTPVTIDSLSLNSADATLDHTGGTLSVLGTADLLAGDFLMNGGTIDGGTWDQNGGTFEFGVSSNNIITNSASVLGDLDFDISSGRVRLENGATFTGDAHLTANSSILVVNDTQTLDNKTINLDANGVQFGVAGTNTLTLGPGMLVRGEGRVDSDTIVGGDSVLINQGTIRADLAGQTLTLEVDTLTSQAGGTIEATNGSTIAIGSTDAGTTTTNLGDYNVLNGSTMRLLGDWSNTSGNILVDATSELQIEGDFATADLGTIDNSAGGSVFLESDWDNSAGALTFSATTGSWTMDGAIITGGTLVEGVGGQRLNFDSDSANILTGGLVYNGDLHFDISSGRLRLENGATFTGDAHLTANSSILVVNDTQTLDNKTINLDANGVQFGVAGTNTLTLGPGILVRGEGRVDSDTLVSGDSVILNQGVIRADLAGQTLNIVVDTLTNQVGGVIEATNASTVVMGSNSAGTTTTNQGDFNVLNGSTMRLFGEWINTSGTILVDATSELQIEGDFTTAGLGTIDNSAGGSVSLESDWDNSAGALTFNATTGSWIMDGATITGGTLTEGVGGEGLIFDVSSSNILTGGLVYDGDLDFDISSGRVRLEGGATFAGDAHLTASSSILVINDTQTLDNKTINLDANGVQFGVAGTNTLTLGPGMLVRGEGRVDSDTLASGDSVLINQGTIRADLIGQILNVDLDTLINQAGGTIEATNDSTIVIGASAAGTTTTNQGDYNVLNGSTMRLLGDWTNTTGTILIDATSDLQIRGDFATADLGTIDNSAGGSVILESNWDNTAGAFIFNATTGSWIMDGATITAGTLTEGVGGEGLIFASSSSNIFTGGLVYDADLTLDVSSGRLRLEGGATFTGDAHLTASSTVLVVNDTQTLDNKTINLDANGVQFGVAGTNTLTLGPDLLVRGRGRVDSDSLVGGDSVVINQGTIRADLNGQTLTVDPDELNHTGLIEAVGGGDIRVVSNTLTNLTGTTLTGGTWRVADGGKFDFETGSIVTNQAELILDGVGSNFRVIANTPIEDVLTSIGSAGVLRVIGNRDYPGTTAFTNAGDLELGGGTFGSTSFDNPASGELFGHGTVTPQVNSAGTVRASGGTLTLAGGLNGTGATVLIEPGAILAFDGSDFVDTGATFTLTDGRLQGAANINLGIDLTQSGGTLAPGTPVGTTELIGAYDLIGGALETQFGGPTNPIDLLESTGDIDIALVGTSLLLRPVDAMAAGTYTLLRTTGGTLTGTFDIVTDLGIYDDLVGVQYSATEVTLTLDRDLLVGDLNFDGFVGIADLNIVLGAWNQNVAPGIWPLGDPSGDGFIGIDDLNAVLGNWNAGTPPTTQTSVPEPGSIMILTGLALGLSRRAR